MSNMYSKFKQLTLNLVRSEIQNKDKNINVEIDDFSYRVYEYSDYESELSFSIDFKITKR